LSIAIEEESKPETESQKVEDMHLPRKDFKISEAQALALDRIAERLNLSGRTEVVRFFIGHFQEETGDILPFASFENIMHNDDPEDATRTPIAIVAKPRGGKSTTLDGFLRKCAEKDVPFIVFTQKTEPRCYSWISKRRKYHNFNAARVVRSKNHQWRVDLDSDENVRLGEVERICQDFIRLQTDKHLKSWVLVFDEGSSYLEIGSFMEMLREMRKYVLRIITTATESGLLKMCEEMSPVPKKSN